MLFKDETLSLNFTQSVKNNDFCFCVWVPGVDLEAHADLHLQMHAMHLCTQFVARHVQKDATCQQNDIVVWANGT